MSRLPLTPPASPPAIYQAEDTPPPNAPNLPALPSPTDSREEEARICKRIAQHYWVSHFEVEPVDPASFIDRLMTDYVEYEGDVVGEWLENMRTPYKLYRVCLNYGAASGTPAKALEAKRYQKIKLPAAPGVQEVRNQHRQMRMAAALHPDRPTHRRADQSDQQPAAQPEPLSAKVTIVNYEGTPQAMVDAPPEDSVQLDKTPSPERTLSKRKSKVDLQTKFQDFQDLMKGDIGETWPSPEELEKKYQDDWKPFITALKSTNKKDRHSENLAQRSIPASVQSKFVDAIGLLWNRELRLFFQKEITNPEKHKDMARAVVAAADTKERPIKKLGNFTHDWDFSRFVRLVDSFGTSQLASFPSLRNIVIPLKTCRDARNKHAHNDFDPRRQAPPDSQFASLIDAARTNLPRINSLEEGSSRLRDIYQKLRELESCLYIPGNGESEDDVFEFVERNETTGINPGHIESTSRKE